MCVVVLGVSPPRLDAFSTGAIRKVLFNRPRLFLPGGDHCFPEGISELVPPLPLPFVEDGRPVHSLTFNFHASLVKCRPTKLLGTGIVTLLGVQEVQAGPTSSLARPTGTTYVAFWCGTSSLERFLIGGIFLKSL